MPNNLRKAVTRTGMVAAVSALFFGVLGPISPAHAEDAPTREQLEQDCSGEGWNHGGTGYTIYLNGCTFEEGSSSDYPDWKANGITVSNCSGGTRDLDLAEAQTETWTTGWSIGGSLSGAKNWLTAGLTGGYNWSHSTSVTNTLTAHIPPGQKGVLKTASWMHKSEGKIRVDYSQPIYGQSTWYIDDVSITTPTDQVEKSINQVSCGETLMNGL